MRPNHEICNLVELYQTFRRLVNTVWGHGENELTEFNTQFTFQMIR